MKKSIMTSIALVTTLGLGLTVWSQTSTLNNQSQSVVKLEKDQEGEVELAEILKASPAAQALEVEVAQKNNPQAILEAGKLGDKSLIPYLKFLSKKKNLYAQVALVQLGDDQILKQILDETRADNEPSVRLDAITKLVLIENKAAYNKLYDLLDDKKLGLSTAKDEFFASPSTVTRLELSKKFEKTPQIFDDSPENIALWKQWFIKNNLID